MREQLDDNAPLESGLRGEENPGHSASAQLTLNDVCGAEAGFQLLAKIG